MKLTITMLILVNLDNIHSFDVRFWKNILLFILKTFALILLRLFPLMMFEEK